MGLSAPNTIFGIHSVTPYNPDTRKPYGTAKVVGQMSLNFTGELTPLNGGSNAYPWRVERGLITTEASFTLREKPVWDFEVFNGKAATVNAAETGGAIATALANAGGTSVVASTGLASVGVLSGSEANLKTGTYVIEAASSTTINVFALTDVDFAQGTDAAYVDDTLKINASPLTITTGGTTDITAFGLRFTGGAGTIGMTAGDTATFEVRAINTGSHEVIIGSSTEVYSDFGLLIAAQKSGSKAITYVDLFRCQSGGSPINFVEQAFSEAEMTVQAFRDAVRDGVYAYRYVNASN